MDWARIFSRRREGEEPPEDSRSSAWASRSTPMRPTRFSYAITAPGPRMFQDDAVSAGGKIRW